MRVSISAKMFLLRQFGLFFSLSLADAKNILLISQYPDAFARINVHMYTLSLIMVRVTRRERGETRGRLIRAARKWWGVDDLIIWMYRRSALCAELASWLMRYLFDDSFLRQFLFPLPPSPFSSISLFPSLPSFPFPLLLFYSVVRRRLPLRFCLVTREALIISQCRLGNSIRLADSSRDRFASAEYREIHESSDR